MVVGFNVVGGKVSRAPRRLLYSKGLTSFCGSCSLLLRPGASVDDHPATEAPKTPNCYCDKSGWAGRELSRCPGGRSRVVSISGRSSMQVRQHYDTSDVDPRSRNLEWFL